MTSDAIQMTFIKRVMQRQADSAAIAGAFALSQGRAPAASVAIDLARNSNTVLTADPVVENAPSVGPYAGNSSAVRVALLTDKRFPFLGFVIGTSRISAEATAAVVGLGEYCAIALETTAVTGISMGGNTTVDFKCGLMTNSPASSAVTAGGSSIVIASPVAAVGGLPPSSNYASGTELFPYSVPQIDPYAKLPALTVGNGSSSGNVKSNQIRTLDPGTYAGMDIKGTATLNPGVYYLDGGTLSFGSQAVVSGTGVTFVLSSRQAATRPSLIAKANMNGGARVTLTAPSTGTYAGVLIYQDRRALDSGDNKINGNSSSKLQGAVYFPKQEIEFNGNTGININCIKLVARRMVFTGNSKVINLCPNNSGAAPVLGTKIKLVG
jgi:hypothetical protein